MPDTSSENAPARYGERVAWTPEKPRFRLVRVLVAWVVAAAAVAVSVWITPGTDIDGVGAAFLVAALIGVLNAVLPPILAAIRLPFMLVTGFLLVLVADALLLIVAARAAARRRPRRRLRRRAADLAADRRGARWCCR